MLRVKSGTVVVAVGKILVGRYLNRVQSRT